MSLLQTPLKRSAQPLACHKCGNQGAIEYERLGPATSKFVTITGAFTYEKDEAKGTQRLLCDCGDLVYFSRLKL
jgi:hypothetical protein